MFIERGEELVKNLIGTLTIGYEIIDFVKKI